MATSTYPELVFGAAWLDTPESFWAESDSNIFQAYDVLKKHGVSKLDTAEIYAGSEAKIGATHAGTTHGLTIDTKFPGGFGQNDLSREGIFASLKASIDRLGVEQVDIYYLHAPVPPASLEAVLAGLDDGYKAGYFRRLGVSNFPPALVQKTYDVAKANGFVVPTVYQGNYSAVARKIEDDLFPVLRKLGIVFYAYSPTAGGFLAKTREFVEAGKGRFSPDQIYGIYHALYVKDSFLNALDLWGEIAKAEGVSRVELAYRWIGFHSALREDLGDGIVLGASNLTQLEGTLGFFKKGPLSEESAKRIDELWKVVEAEAGVDNWEILSQKV